jgi:hypothetical protein
LSAKELEELRKIVEAILKKKNDRTYNQINRILNHFLTYHLLLEKKKMHQFKIFSSVWIGILIIYSVFYNRDH